MGTKQLSNTHYDDDKPVELWTDWSPKAIAAVLMQEGKMVHCASRSLNQAEKNYAAVEGEMLALTFGLMLSDYMSRQVINAVFPTLKAEWALTDSQLGMLVSVVALLVGVMCFPIALLADRIGRVKAATVMAVMWGIATVGSGLTGNFMQMLFARALVGLGEAGYGGAGGAILVSVFPPQQRATVIGAFFSAGLFGPVDSGLPFRPPPSFEMAGGIGGTASPICRPSPQA